MKKLISAALALAMAAMCFVGCGSSASSAPASSEAGSPAASAEGAGAPAEDIKVGVIHIGDPAAGSGYSYAHDQGIVAMQQSLGLGDDQIVRKDRPEIPARRNLKPFPVPAGHDRELRIQRQQRQRTDVTITVDDHLRHLRLEVCRSVGQRLLCLLRLLRTRLLRRQHRLLLQNREDLVFLSL